MVQKNKLEGMEGKTMKHKTKMMMADVMMFLLWAAIGVIVSAGFWRWASVGEGLGRW